MAQEKKIFIIEDNRETCILLEQVFNLKGCESISSGTIKDSDIILRNENPSSIFIDNNLPDGSGFEYISKIKEINPNTRVIAMTANLSDENKRIAYSGGADYFLEKPFTINQVMNLI